MAKLPTQSTPGFNSGKNHAIRLMRISDIVLDPEFSELFRRDPRIIQEIHGSIKTRGFDPEQPLVLWKGHKTLVDGYTRHAASVDAKLEEVWVLEREFETKEEALFYAFERQAIRRNLTGAEILNAIKMLPEARSKKGEGRSAERLASRLGISPSTVYQSQDILKNSTEEVIQAVQNGEMTITAAYKKNHPRKEIKPDKPDVEFVVTDAMNLPDHIKFLKGAVILLCEKELQSSAELLINHYLKKNEKNGFFKLLPESTRKMLDKRLAMLA